MTDQPRDPSGAGGTGDEPTRHDIPAGGQQGAPWEPQQSAYWQTEPTTVQPQPPYPPPGQPSQHYGAPPSQGQPPSYAQQPSYGTPQPPAGQQGSSPYYPPSQPAAPAGGGQSGDGFFPSLLDFGFTKYGTPSIVKIVYPLIAAVVLLYYLVFTAFAFQASAGFGVLTLLVLGPLGVIVVLAMARMTLEFYLAVVRLAQDVREVKDRGSSS